MIARFMSFYKPGVTYDNCIEDWPKCMHGEDCLVQMLTEGTDGGRCFFKCPRAWVILSIKGVLDMFNICVISSTCFVVGLCNPLMCRVIILERHEFWQHCADSIVKMDMKSCILRCLKRHSILE